jgi:hypothetical protein
LDNEATDTQQQIRSSPPVVNDAARSQERGHSIAGMSYPLSAVWNQQYDALVSRARREGSQDRTGGSRVAEGPGGVDNDLPSLDTDRSALWPQQSAPDDWHFDMTLQSLFMAEDLDPGLREFNNLDGHDSLMDFGDAEPWNAPDSR